jgi:hypothetical protein
MKMIRLGMAGFMIVVFLGLNSLGQAAKLDLFQAIVRGDKAQVRTLLSKGIDVNAKNRQGMTALMAATIKGDFDIVKALLDRGADPNSRDNLGRTPLMFAAQKGNLNIARVLLAKGAEINAIDLNHFNALSVAKASRHTQMVNFLKEHGAQELPPRHFTRAAPGAKKPPEGGRRVEMAPAPSPPITAAPAEQPSPPRAKKSRAMVRALKKVEIPQFPWPPPEPSAFARIPRKLLVKAEGQTKVGDVADRLDSAFEQAGYGEKTWYAVPGGFALASRLEQYNPDGTSKDEPERWSAEIGAPAIFSLKDVIRVLFTPREGHYRIIVFIVTNQPFSASHETVSADVAREWVRKGAFKLPKAIREAEYTPEHYCEALIYEFEQDTRDNPAVFIAPSELQGKTHLRQAKILSALGG